MKAGMCCPLGAETDKDIITNIIVNCKYTIKHQIVNKFYRINNIYIYWPHLQVNQLTVKQQVKFPSIFNPLISKITISTIYLQ